MEDASRHMSQRDETYAILCQIMFVHVSLAPMLPIRLKAHVFSLLYGRMSSYVPSVIPTLRIPALRNSKPECVATFPGCFVRCETHFFFGVYHDDPIAKRRAVPSTRGGYSD